ncbi:MAG: DEAD/DEAH box helicase [Kofleriaceae bacterium]
MAKASEATAATGEHDQGSAEDQRALEWLRCALGLEASQTPFPWQIELLRRFRQGEVVSSLDIPTGLGKTAVMAVWLVARALGAALPRRLVYVVDRRAVVDQATEVAEALCAWVAKARDVADVLGLGDRTLPISTLRGQHVDNRAWLEDPSSPAIIVGTIDMVGSRLLFSGYGVSSKMRPYHAGLLGADTLVVLDEAHLVPAFEDLLRQVEEGASSFGPTDAALRALVPPFKLLSLSATGRQTTAATPPLTLTDEDRRNAVVVRRLNATKSLNIVELAAASEAPSAEDSKVADDASEDDDAKKKDKGPKLAAVLAKQAWELTKQGSSRVRCLVFCNARKDATAVAAELRNLAKSASAPEPSIELFVGGRRVKERVEARDALARLGFLAGSSVTLERSVFLIATSAGEVGVDLDADHMVCDLVAWERMVQRLGRVNRRGDGNAKVVVVVENEPTPSESTTKAIEKRTASSTAKEQLAELTKQLSALQGEKTSAARGQKKSADAKAAEEKRKRDVKELKKLISAAQKRVKAFKDADSKVVARHEVVVTQHRALRSLLEAVGENGSLSPCALLNLRSRTDLTDALRDATTIEPLRPELTRPLVDAWSMTSLDEHPGRPDVDPWLRGFRSNDPPQTTVVWRRYLPVRADEAFNAKAAKRFFDAAPPHTSEQLEAETHLVLDWLIERAAALSGANDEDAVLKAKQVVVIALGARGELRGWRTLEQLAATKSRGKKESKEAKKDREQATKQLEALLVGATLIVDSRLGGLTDGLLDDKAQLADAADAGSTWLARPDAPDVPVTGFRIRTVGASEEDGAAWRTMPGTGWVRRHLFVTSVVNGEPSTALVVDGWAGDAATEEERGEADRPQQLDEHQSWAADCADAIGQRLGIEQARVDLLALAARLHDEGKRAARWQRAFKAPLDGRPYAKTKGPIDFDILDGYRHELGSLPYVEAHEDFKKLSSDDQDFVLHLIAAHHGFARPVIGTSGCDDAPPSIIDERARAVALRFSRLSRRWGPWGLAWWEALLRSADQTASRRNQRAATAPEEQPR